MKNNGTLDKAMQNQEIPDFIDNKQIVAIFDLPENVKIMVKENIPLYHWHLIKKKETYFFITKKIFIEILKKRVLTKYFALIISIFL